MFIYFERKRERAEEGQKKERERERERTPSGLRAVSTEPDDEGLELTNREIMT